MVFFDISSVLGHDEIHEENDNTIQELNKYIRVVSAAIVANTGEAVILRFCFELDAFRAIRN